MTSVDNDIAVLRIGFAFVNADLAQLKNRSALLWFLLSLFLGPFAALIMAFMKPRPANPEARSNDEL